MSKIKSFRQALPTGNANNFTPSSHSSITESHNETQEVKLSSGGWIRFNTRSKPCPVCHGQRRDCRQSKKSEIVFCRSGFDNAGFKFIGEDANGFGMFLDRAIADSQDEANREEWLQRRKLQQEGLAKADKARLTASMPVVERDKLGHKLLNLLTLQPEHKEDLINRGFSADDIERIGFRSVVKGQPLPEQFSESFPGVTRGGRSLLVAENGYINPVYNQDGLIHGFQLRVWEAEDNKHRWFSNEGNYRLPDGEIPLAHCKPEAITRNWIAFSEGTGPKPHLASIRLGCPVLGAAGGNFAGSPLQVKSALASGNMPVLIPDGGAIANPHVMRQYEKLAAMVPGLQVLWWGQWEKSSDVDEVSDEVLASARLIPWKEFQRMSPEADRQRQLADQFRKKQNLELIERCFKLSARSKAPKGKGFDKPKTVIETAVEPGLGAIVLYDRRNDGRLEMPVTADTVPTFETWIEKGRPTLIVEPEHRVWVCLQLVLNRFPYVLIKDIVGAGKSRTAGEFFEAWTGFQGILEELKHGVWKGVYASPDYRRPSNELLEAIPQAVSGAGVMVDESKHTPLGEPYTRRAKRGETPDIPGLCIHEDAYQVLTAQGYPMGRGQDSAFCQQCPMFKDCGYLKALAEQQSEPVLRTHVSKISVGEDENVVAFIDEAGASIAGDVVRDSSITAMEIEIGELAKTDPYFYADVSPVLKALKHAVTRAAEEQGSYGLTHKELMGFLPTRAELQRLLVDSLWTPHGAPDMWEIPTLNQIAGRIQKSIRHDAEKQLNEATDPKQREELVEKCLTIGVLPRLLKAIDGKGRVDVSLVGKTIKFRYRDRRHGKAIAKLKTAFLMDATPDRREIARNLGIDEGDIVSISSPKPSFANITFKVVRGFGKAGRNREHYKDGVLIKSPYSTMQRIISLVEKVSQEAIASNPDTKIALLDLKHFVEGDRVNKGRYDDLLASTSILKGIHFADGRNTNRFKECSLLFSVGTPVQNIGDLLSQWHLRTGESHTINSAPSTFWAWVNGKVTTELLQEGGRSRAQHRPGEWVDHYILSDLSQGQIHAIQDYYPGCTVEVVDAYEICPQAAPKGQQRQQGVMEAIASAIRAGEKPTLAKVASQVGVSESRVSQILKGDGGFKAISKTLVSLFMALNNRTKVLDLTEEQRMMAQYAFPDLVDKLTESDNPVEVLEEFVETAEMFGYRAFETIFSDRVMLSAVPATTLARLIGFFMGYLPRPFLEGLETESRTLVEVAA